MAFSRIYLLVLCITCAVNCKELLESPTKLLSEVTPEVQSNLLKGKERNPVPEVKPVQPQMTNCYMYFPGTPGWNECFSKFTQDMADFQTKMHEYVKSQSKEAGSNTGSYIEMSPGGYYSSNFNSHSTSNSYIGGYAIRAINMGLSTSIRNGIVKITLDANGPIDSFERKVVGDEIQIYMVSRGVQKSVRILVPNGVKIQDLKVDRTADAVYVTAPAISDRNAQISQSSSSSSSSNTGNGFSFHTSSSSGGPMPQMPVMPMGDFPNMFQNMFQNIFGSIFGGPGPQQRLRADRPSGYPGMWFY